jgi:LPS-assembly protein
VKLDFDANEGVAEDAVLRFLGLPILALPVLSFPLTDARKSGWLPPSLNLDNKSGVEFAMPYYWNIAPQRDATFTPGLATRRGVSLDSEYRWLEAWHSGQASLHVLPHDRVIGSSRSALRVLADADTPDGTVLRLRAKRVSNDDYWKDFPRVVGSMTPRLLEQDLSARREFRHVAGDLTLFGRVQRWQVLEDVDPLARFDAPYQREPQLGARYKTGLGGGLELWLESEVNRFSLPGVGTGPARPTGVRWHSLGSLSRPWIVPQGWITPKLSFNAASYRLDQALADGRTGANRVIPTLSIDAGLTFERNASWFGRSVLQTLEPRLLYVNTPFREQRALPSFDAAAKDFNFDSIFTESAFSGVDRVSDAHQITAGVTTRWIDPVNGTEWSRLGIAQRYLLRDQQITPDSVPFTQRFSDVLVLGATQVAARWWVDTSIQYSPETNRVTRSVLGARFSPGPFRTISAGYRLARGSSEQVELAWQWPVYGRERAAPAAASSTNGTCRGAWYSVGRINYSTRDSRITDSVVGVEYDAGCWIGRVVAERLSTGRSEATTRLLLQLELVGLSRLGSNPLQVLKDNIPGYRLLREDPATLPSPSTHE